MKKYARRGIVFLLAVVMTLSFSGMKLHAAEPGGGSKPTDVYIVIDNSYSMGKGANDGIGTDPDRLAIDCADSFYATSPTGSAIGVMTFSGEVENIEELVVNDGQYQKGTWDSIYTQTGVNTDIGEALRTAGNKLISDGRNPNKAIVLVTDGVSRDGEDYEPTMYNGEPIPVYCIFINQGKSEDEQGARDFLGDVASQSGTGEIYEINSADDIKPTMDKIARTIYEDGEQVTGEVIELKENETFTKTVTIPNEVYEFSCSIEHDTAASFDLTITDPNGKVLYENKTPGTKYVTSNESSSVTDIKILLPIPGDYEFKMVSDKDQEINPTFIMINATLNLSLDKNSVTAGEGVTASYEVKGNTPSKVKSASIRIHDFEGNVVEDSTNSKNIKDNNDGTFLIDTTNLAEGTYNVYAIADMDDGKQYASVFKSFSVGASGAASSGTSSTAVENEPAEPAKEESGKKGGFPILPVILGLVGLLAIAGIAFYVISHRSTVGYVTPAAGSLNVTLRSEGQLIGMILLQLPASLYDGKPKNLYDVLTQEIRFKNGDVSVIPQETQYYSISCTGDKKGPQSTQQINITDQNNNLVLLIPYGGMGSFEAGETAFLQFKWDLQFR